MEAAILLPLTIPLQLGGGLLIAFALPLHRWVVLKLAVFTVTVSLVFQPFWIFPEEPMATLQLSLFFIKIAIAGGLVFAAGANNTRNF